jgi:hypothetical protein
MRGRKRSPKFCGNFGGMVGQLRDSHVRYSQMRTSLSATGMSALCDKPTFAQLFCVAGDQCLRNGRPPTFKRSSSQSHCALADPSGNCFLLSFHPVDPSLQFRVVDLVIILYLFQHEIEPSDLTLRFVQPFHQLVNVVNSCYRNDEWPHKIP